MNNISLDPNENAKLRIRELNDDFRQTLVGGTVLFTAGILSLGPRHEASILRRIRSFDAFTYDNDPHGEHDFGSFEVADEVIFFKIDYFDLWRAEHSSDPSNPEVTERVMTIMLANEW